MTSHDVITKQRVVFSNGIEMEMGFEDNSVNAVITVFLTM